MSGVEKITIGSAGVHPEAAKKMQEYNNKATAPVDEEKSNASKYMIGAVALAAVIATGIAIARGHGDKVKKAGQEASQALQQNKSKPASSVAETVSGAVCNKGEQVTVTVDDLMIEAGEIQEAPIVIVRGGADILHKPEVKVGENLAQIEKQLDEMGIIPPIHIEDEVSEIVNNVEPRSSFESFMDDVINRTKENERKLRKQQEEDTNNALVACFADIENRRVINSRQTDKIDDALDMLDDIANKNKKDVNKIELEEIDVDTPDTSILNRHTDEESLDFSRIGSDNVDEVEDVSTRNRNIFNEEDDDIYSSNRNIFGDEEDDIYNSNRNIFGDEEDGILGHSDNDFFSSSYNDDSFSSLDSDDSFLGIDDGCDFF